MPRLQRFSNVCDGGHIHGLNNLTKQSLAMALGQNRKAVLVVGNGQCTALAVLRGLKTKKGSILGQRQGFYNYATGAHHRNKITAKKLTTWSGTGQLWMVRQDGKKF